MILKCPNVQLHFETSHKRYEFSITTSKYHSSLLQLKCQSINLSIADVDGDLLQHILAAGI